MTRKEASRLGGQSHSREHMAKLAKLSAATRVKGDRSRRPFDLRDPAQRRVYLRACEDLGIQPALTRLSGARTQSASTKTGERSHLSPVASPSSRGA